jgi:SulP family sulfate permease
MLVGANARVQAKLERAGIVELIGVGNSFARFDDALAVCRELAEHDPRMAHERPVLLSEAVEATAPQKTRRD